MKKLFSSILIIVFILSVFNFVAFSETLNIISNAKITSDIPAKSGYTIDKMTDGKTNTPFVLDNNLTEHNFPYYIEFDFKDYNVSLSYLKIYSMFGVDAGITNFDVQVFKNDEWVNEKAGIVLKWDTSTSIPEDRTVYFSQKPEANRYRIMINQANLTWNEFRIDEIEFYGEMTGLADPKEIDDFKSLYIHKSTTGSLSLSNKATAMLTDNTEYDFTVEWNVPDNSTEGIYTATGTIPYYSETPTAIIDVYDINKDISAYQNNWAYNLIKKSLQDGLLGSVDTTTVSKPLTRGEIALILFRKGKMQPDFYKKVYSDISYDIRRPIYQKILEDGFFDSIVNTIFEPDKVVTRLEAVKIMTKFAIKNGATIITDCDMGYQDLEGLSNDDFNILKTAFEYGLIKNAEAFRPHDTVTLSEFLSIDITNSANSGLIEKEYSDNGAVLKNPYMGLYSYLMDNGTMKYDIDYPNSEYFTDVTGLSNVYIRTPWSFFEPKNDEYDFSFIDGMIEKFKRSGLQISLRITASETGDVYATPKWVFDDGAKAIRWNSSTGGVSQDGNVVMPDYDDPIFLSHLDDFLFELAKRYDGNPNIAYIDLGTLGVWGEGHTSNSGVSISLNAVQKQLEMYNKHFKKTKILFMDNTHNFMQVKDYAIENGFGYRNDSFTGTFDQAPFWSRDRLERLEGIWQKAPVNMELTHYDWMKTNDYWQGGVGLYDLLWDNHATYLGLHGYSLSMEKENHELFEKLSRRIGYRILPQQVSLTASVNMQGYLNLKAIWKNLGVAPCYNGAYPAITLKDKEGNIVSVMVDSNFNVKDLTVAPEGNAVGVMQEKAFRLHGVLPGGVYEAYLSLGTITGTPEIAMPIEGNDGNRRYYLGDIKVDGFYKISGEQTTGNTIRLTFDVNKDSGNYRYAWPRLDFFDESKGKRGIAGEYTINLRDKYEEFERAMAEKSVYVCEKEVNIPSSQRSNVLGKVYNVYFSMHNLPADETIGIMLSDSGRYCLIGKAYFNENMEMVFTPVN